MLGRITFSRPGIFVYFSVASFSGVVVAAINLDGADHRLKACGDGTNAPAIWNKTVTHTKPLIIIYPFANIQRPQMDATREAQLDTNLLASLPVGVFQEVMKVYNVEL